MTTHTAARTALANLVYVNREMATSTLRADHIRGMRNLLSIAQGMICAGCGDTLIGARVELCHIDSAEYGKGIQPGRVYAGCKECNDYDREECGGDAFTIIARMERPDLVQTSHPTRQACLAGAGNGRRDRVRTVRGAHA